MRSDPFVTVTCDICKSVEEEMIAWDLEGELAYQEWTVSDGKDICPQCSEKEESHE